MRFFLFRFRFFFFLVLTFWCGRVKLSLKIPKGNCLSHSMLIFSVDKGCLENSDLENSDPQTLKTQTLWVSQKLRPSGCIENSDPKNSDPLHWVSRKLGP